MVIHKVNNLKGVPVCWGNDYQKSLKEHYAVKMTDNIDDVSCVPCLRALAKDAVLYGNGRRPSRKW